jgi:hypothetical protein
MKEKGNELLNGSFFVLELSIVAFPPQAPQKATCNNEIILLLLGGFF